MSSAPASYTLSKAGEGKTLSLFGVAITVKASAAATSGVLTLIEYTAPPHFAGPQPHFHRVTTETFYMMEGTLTFTLGGETVDAGPGDFIVVPPGVVHAFRNATDRPAKFLATLNPGGMEGYFEDLIELVRSEPTWPPADLSKVAALARRYDTYPPGET